MGKFALVVCLLLLGGVASSYPAWSQIASQISASVSLADSANSANTSNSTKLTSTNSTSGSFANSTTSIQVETTTESSTTYTPFGSDWVSQFISVVDTYREGESLTQCPRLNSFAMTRFGTMTNGSNWEIVHYGYNQDVRLAFGNTGGQFAEEYFFPTEPYLSTPQNFASNVKTYAPGHWSDLTNTGYMYYGAYYQGQGPVLLFRSSCAPHELAAGINQTQAFTGCSYQKVVGTWLIIELTDNCPR